MGSLFPSPEFVPASNPARPAPLQSMARKSRGASGQGRVGSAASSPFRVHEEGAATKAAAAAAAAAAAGVSSPRKGRALQSLSANTVSPPPPPPSQHRGGRGGGGGGGSGGFPIKAETRTALPANPTQVQLASAAVVVHTGTLSPSISMRRCN